MIGDLTGTESMTKYIQHHPADCWEMWSFWQFFRLESHGHGDVARWRQAYQLHPASHHGALEIFWNAFLKPRIDYSYIDITKLTPSLVFHTKVAILYQILMVNPFFKLMISVIFRFLRSFLSTCTSWDVRFSPQPTWGTWTLEVRLQRCMIFRYMEYTFKQQYGYIYTYQCIYICRIYIHDIHINIINSGMRVVD